MVADVQNFIEAHTRSMLKIMTGGFGGDWRSTESRYLRMRRRMNYKGWHGNIGSNCSIPIMRIEGARA